jgi:hypothetical protein
MGRAPVHVDDSAIGAAIDADPIAWPIGAAEIQDDAREHVTQPPGPDRPRKPDKT